MQFEAEQPLPLLLCSTCHSTGYQRWNTCRVCRGFSPGRHARGKWLYWDYPLERYHLALQKVRRIFNRVRSIIVFIAGLALWFWSGYFWYQKLGTLIQHPEKYLAWLKVLPQESIIFFWLGALFFLYLWYRVLREEQYTAIVEHFDYNASIDRVEKEFTEWKEAHALPRKRRIAISDSFTKEALTALATAYTLADQAGFNQLTPIHLFYALLSFNRIANVFIRLGIVSKDLQSKVRDLAAQDTTSTGGTTTAPVVSPETYQVFFKAYEEAYQAHQEYVSVTELLVAVVKLTPSLQELLYDADVDHEKLVNVVEWARIRERLSRQYHTFQKASAHRSKYGMDRAMTAVATPYLNQFSEDMTRLAQLGYTNPCIAREKEIEEIFQVIDGGQHNVLLVGDYGTGKKSILEGLAEKMIVDDVPNRLVDKRLVRLSVSSLLAGTTPAGAVNRLITLFNEVARARNIILVIHNIHELVGVSAGGEGSLDVAGALAENLSVGAFVVLATTTLEAHAKIIANSKLSALFAKVDIREMDEDQSIQVLESKVGYVEYKQNVFFAYEALAKAVFLAKRFIRDTVLPGSALELMSEAATYTHNKKGPHTLVSGEEVAEVVAKKTHIPVTTVGANETEKLLHLEEAMHERVVGQDEAVNLVANALRRARANIRAASRPIANFLFLGPTGVGKTELAKTIAEVYFGGEDKMIRLDMSEYQDKASIYRLIGAPNEKGTGVLTEAIRRSPFALLLLDEIEKADKDVLNLFLQVMDDGRLSDSTGRVVDFTNTIIIATSNAGTSDVQEAMRAGMSSDIIKDRLLHGGLKEYFRPEFLNRFDGIVLFKALDQAGIKQIAGLMLKRVAKDLEAKGIELKVEDAALDYFAQVGFDPEFGARPLRRALEEHVENSLASLLLGGKISRHDTVVIGAGGNISVE